MGWTTNLKWLAGFHPSTVILCHWFPGKPTLFIIRNIPKQKYHTFTSSLIPWTMGSQGNLPKNKSLISQWLRPFWGPDSLTYWTTFWGGPFPADPWDPVVFPGILLLHQVTKSGSFHSTVQLLQRVGRWRKTRVAFFFWNRCTYPALLSMKYWIV